MVASFLTGVLLAAAFLTGIGGAYTAGALLLTFVSAFIVLTARSVRWLARHHAARSQARVDDFGKYAVPQLPVADGTVLPA